NTFGPYVVWAEHANTNWQIYMKHLDLANWYSFAGEINRVNTQNAYGPRLAIVPGGETPYVTWFETTADLRDEVFVKYYTAGMWVQAGSSLNEAGNSRGQWPDIAMDSATPFVCWQEEYLAQNRIYVKKQNGLAWDLLGGPLNESIAENAYAPRMEAYATMPYVTWYEEGTPASRVYVKKWNGYDWEMIGGGSLNMNANQQARNPALALALSTPYVVWEEWSGTHWQIFVKYADVTTWLPVGSADSLNIDANQDALSPSIALWNLTPYVAWCESDGNTTQVYVKRYNGSGWELLDGSLNHNLLYGAEAPEIALVDTTPYVTWIEWDGSLVGRVYVKHWDPNSTPTFTPTVSLSPTISTTPTSTLTSTPSSTRTPLIPSATATTTPTPTCTATLTLYLTSFAEYTPTQTPSFTTTYTPVTPARSATASMTPTSTAESVPLAPTATCTVDLFRRVSESSPVIIRGNVLRPSLRRPVQIEVFLEKTQRVRVRIYSMRGALVKTVVDEVAAAGRFETIWEGLNQQGELVRSGVYIIFIETDRFKEKRKMVVVR
ncbi:hypothetical protein JW933_04700, partial [candidate division FCPU426 bacterium]|nr:hypothetical protein [candidate division FCPU426 bacterium]